MKTRIARFHALPPASSGPIGWLLAALSFIYWLAVKIRLSLYGLGILPSRPAEGVKVISVGNLTVGGTGKTPFTIMLAGTIQRKAAIVSRGYGRKSDERVQVVSDGRDVLQDYPQAADEALICAMEPGKIPVICAPRRIDGLLAARDRFGAKIAIMDDAFSHLGARRDLDMLLVDATNPFGNGHLLPAGPLREPLSSIARADAIVITRANFVEEKRLEEIRRTLSRYIPGGKPLYLCDMVPGHVIDPDSHRHIADKWLKGKDIILLSGIASPSQFESTVKGLGANVVRHHAFSDHHPFTAGEISSIKKDVKENMFLLTTQKDFVRIPESERSGIHILTIAAVVREEEFGILLNSL